MHNCQKYYFAAQLKKDLDIQQTLITTVIRDPQTKKDHRKFYKNVVKGIQKPPNDFLS